MASSSREKTWDFERPKNRAHGDWSTTVAMKIAPSLGVKPRGLAGELAREVAEIDGVAAVDVAGPGFINITLGTAAAAEIARTIVDVGEDYGRNTELSGRAINIEFVSANPPGPLHLGHTRWAALATRSLASCCVERRDDA